MGKAAKRSDKPILKKKEKRKADKRAASLADTIKGAKVQPETDDEKAERKADKRARESKGTSFDKETRKAAKKAIVHYDVNNWQEFQLEAKKKTKGLPSPIPGVELELGQVSLLASVPGAGKTQMAMAMQYFLHNKGFPVGMISAEMTYPQLIARWIAHGDKELGDKFHAVMENPDDKNVKLSKKQWAKVKKLHKEMLKTDNGKKVAWFVWTAKNRNLNELLMFLARVDKESIQFLIVENLLDMKEMPVLLTDKRHQMILHNVELLIKYAAHKNIHIMLNTHLNKEGEIRAATEIERLVSNAFRLEKKPIPVLDDNGNSLNTEGGSYDRKDASQEIMLENKLYLRSSKTRFASDDPNGLEVIMCQKSGRILQIGDGPNIYGETSDGSEDDYFDIEDDEPVANAKKEPIARY